MVDLMMWLVIAALLLAAALQGIGYYQKSAYLYQMKSDTLHAVEVVSATVANTDGEFTPEAVTAGTNETAKTAEITITPEAGASDADGYVLRTEHEAVEDKDVLFISKQRGSYAPGVHVVPKGTVVDADGGTEVAPPGGGGGSIESPVLTPANEFTPKLIEVLNAQIAYYNQPEMVQWMHDANSPESSAEVKAAAEAAANDSYMEMIMPLYDQMTPEEEAIFTGNFEEGMDYDTDVQPYLTAQVQFVNNSSVETQRAFIIEYHKYLQKGIDTPPAP